VHQRRTWTYLSADVQKKAWENPRSEQGKALRCRAQAAASEALLARVTPGKEATRVLGLLASRDACHVPMLPYEGHAGGALAQRWRLGRLRAAKVSKRRKGRGRGEGKGEGEGGRGRVVGGRDKGKG